MTDMVTIMAPSLTTGTKLGRYEIRSQLGAGGMGEVYLAEDTKLNRKVAIKILPANLASDQDRMSLPGIWRSFTPAWATRSERLPN